MKLSIDAEGIPQVEKEIEKATDRYRRALGAALYAKGEDIMGLSVEQMVPVDTGRLRATHYVSPPVGKAMQVLIGYGTDYALEVHEKHPTKSKYLQRALDQKSSGYARHVALLTKAFFKTGEGVGSGKYPKEPEDPGPEWQREQKKGRG